jgi:hypothetical protein
MKKTYILLYFGLVIFLGFFLVLNAHDTWMPSDIRLDSGDPPGANFSRHPQIACSGDNVYAVWDDTRNGNRDIYFNYSHDKGKTWQASDIRLDTGDPLGDKESENPQIACSGDNVYCVWEDYRGDNWDIYFNYSHDGGATWQASAIRVDHEASHYLLGAETPQIACSGNKVYVVWSDVILGTYDIYFNYSTDGGATWQPSDIRLDTGDSPGASYSDIPHITCSGDYVYVLWRDERNGPSADIYFNSSTDGGATWQASDIRLDSGDSPGASSTVHPQIACEGSTVCAVYSDQRNGNMADIYMNYSTDGGVNWLPSDVRVDVGDGAGTNYSYEPDISASGNQVFIVWNESRNGNPDIFCNYITLGDPWAPGFRVDAGDPPGANTSVKPHITNSDNFVFVIWQDFRNGLTDIYLNFSTNNGEDWQNRSIRLDSGDLPGDNSSHQAQIAASGNNMFAVWYDDRNGSSDIYFNTMAPPDLDIKANGSDGPITITQADLLSITIEMKAGTLRGQDSDWWVIAQTPGGIYHYEPPSDWEKGLKVSHQGPLSNLPLSEILSRSGLHTGSYTLYFGVDLVMDGKLSHGLMFSDMVEVTITP